jgi:hypothetical protein
MSEGKGRLYDTNRAETLKVSAGNASSIVDKYA